MTLGVTTYLLGLAVGSLILAPISETYGRKPVYAVTMIIFCILIIPCAQATSMAEIIAVRFFAAVAGSSMIANAPGTVGDIVSDEYRALAFSIWSIGPLNGPGTPTHLSLNTNTDSLQLSARSSADLSQSTLVGGGQTGLYSSSEALPPRSCGSSAKPILLLYFRRRPS